MSANAEIGDGGGDLEGGDVIFFFAERRNFGDLTGEFLVLEGFDNDASSLIEIDLADVGFIHFALDVHFADVTEGHDRRSLRAENEDGADGVADVYIAGKDQAVNRADDGGIAKIFCRV